MECFITISVVTDNSRTILLSTSDSSQTFDSRNIYKSEDYEKSIVHLGYNNIENIQRNNIEDNICEQNLENIQTVYTNLSTAKKRKLSQDQPLVKSEPGIQQIICLTIIITKKYHLCFFF